MGRAIFTVSKELLCDLLNLPEGSQVFSVFRLHDTDEGYGYSAPEFGVTVEHADLPDGLPHPIIKPVFQRNQGALEFVEWGATWP